MEPCELLEGRCQCGQVRYRVAGETVALFICHCTECQRQSASAFGMALWLRNYSKEVLGGELEAWIRTTPTGKQLVCEFCSRCGTRVECPELGAVARGYLVVSGEPADL